MENTLAVEHQSHETVLELKQTAFNEWETKCCNLEAQILELKGQNVELEEDLKERNRDMKGTKPTQCSRFYY